MPNNRCLLGMRCPKCGSEEPLYIECVTTGTFYDNGLEDHGEMWWESDSFCQCGECDHEGWVKDFKIEEPSSDTLRKEA